MQESGDECEREQAMSTGREAWQEGQTGYQYSQMGHDQGCYPGQQSMPMQQDSGTSSGYCNLINVLYHALQGAEMIEAYIRDAQQSGNMELVDYFREVQKQYRCLSNEVTQICQQPQMSGKAQIVH
jgi:hypothetical protein